MRTRPLVVCALVTCAPGLAAQSVTLGVSVATMRVQLGSSTPPDSRSGPMIRGLVGLGTPLVQLSLAYGQGGMSEPDGTPRGSVVEGGAWLSVQPWRWLALGGGPRVLALTDGATERWVLWEGGVRLAAPLAGPAVRSYVEARTALAGDVNLAGAAPASVAGAAGLEIGGVTWPAQLQVRYAISHPVADGGHGVGRTLESLEMGIVVRPGR